MEARLGIPRLGTARLGDFRPYVPASIDGVALDGVTRRMRVADLTVRDTEGGVPNTATVRVSGFEPNEGEVIRIGLGALDPNHYVFAGHILTKRRVYEGDKVSNVAYDLSCISHEWRLNRHKVNARFSSQSGSTIATTLMASYAPDFTVVNVAAGLPSIDEITFTNTDLSDALDRLTDRIGAAWYVDEAKDLHLFLTETQTATTIDDTHRGASHVYWERDLSGVRTRVTVEGAGVTAKAPAVPGDTALAVDDLLWYDAAGGIVTSGPQRLTYTGVVAGGAGALVGTTITPTNAPAVARRAAAGLSTGDYRWKVTFVTASGETLASPASSVLTLGGALEPPVSAPSATKKLGGNLSAGAYKWKYSYITAAGETLASSESNSVTMDDVAAPSAIGTASQALGSHLDPSADYSYKMTFVSSSDSSKETLPSSASNTYTSGTGGGAGGKLTRSGNSSPPAGFDRQFYRTDGGGSTYKKMPGASDGFFDDDATYYYDNNIPDGNLGAAVPGANTATYRSADVSVVASGNALVTNIRVYRTATGGSTFKKVADIANTTQTYTDTLADASLGSDELGAATALYQSASLSSIPIGPTGVTQRKIYRTVHDGSTYKLQSTIADNTTTTATDTTADGSLGATEPGSDTSGLTSTTGEVAAGASSIPVTSTAFARSGGGWAFIGSMPIRYTGFTGTALTGIPALGVDGSLGTTVKYGVEIVAAPLLVGIPASGAGAILYSIASGDEVNILVTEDDLAAQAALTELLTASGETPADGVVEEYIQDRRLSKTEAIDRAQAELALLKDPLVTVRYETFDRFTRAGREVTFNSTLLGLVGTFKIQSVTIDTFDAAQRNWPRRVVQASSRRFTFEALLRQTRGA